MGTLRGARAVEPCVPGPDLVAGEVGDGPVSQRGQDVPLEERPVVLPGRVLEVALFHPHGGVLRHRGTIGVPVEQGSSGRRAPLAGRHEAALVDEPGLRVHPGHEGDRSLVGRRVEDTWKMTGRTWPFLAPPDSVRQWTKAQVRRLNQGPWKMTLAVINAGTIVNLGLTHALRQPRVDACG